MEKVCCDRCGKELEGNYTDIITIPYIGEEKLELKLKSICTDCFIEYMVWFGVVIEEEDVDESNTQN